MSLIFHWAVLSAAGAALVCILTSRTALFFKHLWSNLSQLGVQITMAPSPDTSPAELLCVS